MPFENFYEESDKARRRWWKCFGLAFLLFVGYWAFALSALPGVEDDKNASEDSNTEAFDKKERERRIDDLCRYLPLPERFTFIEKDLPTHFNDSTSIIYRFGSNRQPEEIMPFFIIWFKDKGWKSIGNDGTVFRKDKQMVSIRVLAPLDVVTGYEIQCYEYDH